MNIRHSHSGSVSNIRLRPRLKLKEKIVHELTRKALKFRDTL